MAVTPGCSSSTDDHPLGELADEYTSIGEDADVVMMNLEDSLNELEKEPMAHSYEYLFECRKTLMQKVERYRATMEKQSSQIIAMKYKQRQEIERIREFYQAIAYAPTHSSQIVKKSICSSKTATKVLSDIGLVHVCNKT